MESQRDRKFTSVDFGGSIFRDCSFERVKIVDSFLIDVDVSDRLEARA